MAMNQYYITLLVFVISLEVAEVSSSTGTPTSYAKDYWNLKLSNVSMPTLLEDMLPNPSGFDYMEGKARFHRHASLRIYSYDYDLDTQREQLQSNIFKSIFIREEDLLKPGSTHELQYFSPADLGPAFMLKEEQETKAPFKSHNFSQLLKVFSIHPTSVQAELMNFTLLRCESKYGHHLCVPTLEDMADHMNSQFQPSITDLKVFGVDVTPSMEVSRRYRVREVKRAGNGSKIVSCHKGAFPFGVFMCHRLEGRAYHVKLQSLDEDRVEVEAFVSCHHDTSDWSPRYGAFEILNLAPGQTVCHFLLGDSVIVSGKPN